MQVEEKQRIKHFEKVMNDEQARIWKTDTKNYYDQEKDHGDKVILLLTF